MLSRAEIQTVYEQGLDAVVALVAGLVAHFDETGLYVAGRREWLHVASTSQLTPYGNGIEVRMGAQWFDELQLVEVCAMYAARQTEVRRTWLNSMPLPLTARTPNAARQPLTTSPSCPNCRGVRYTMPGLPLSAMVARTVCAMPTTCAN